MKVSLGPRTIMYPTPVLIIGTYDAAGRPNMMNAAWGGLCCSQPPCVAVSVRPQRHTYKAIIQRGAFTVNIPSASHVREADYVGIYTGNDEDKFGSLKLTASRSLIVDAPYVEEFPLALECRLVQSTDLGTHTQFIGEIVDVKASREILGENNMPEISKIDPMVFAPLEHAYYRLGDFVAQAFSVGRKPQASEDAR